MHSLGLLPADYDGEMTMLPGAHQLGTAAPLLLVHVGVFDALPEDKGLTTQEWWADLDLSNAPAVDSTTITTTARLPFLIG